jgi:SRSO17 transposase
MTNLSHEGSAAQLERFVEVVGGALRSDTQRAAFARYVVGLSSDAPAKTLEPLAARACPDAPQAAHQALQYFVAEAPWDDHAVRAASARWALDAVTPAGPVRATVIDDTAFLHRGRHMVGVARQWAGCLGHLAWCQVAVSLAVVTDHDAVPLDLALYLPEAWALDPARRTTAKVPDAILFQPKWDIALDLLRAARDDGQPLGEVVLADPAYGHAADFRRGITDLGLAYGVGVQSDQRLHIGGRTVEVGIWARGLRRTAFRRVTWQHGTHGRLSARFYVRRVRLSDTPGVPHAQGGEVWLVVEWRDGEAAPTRFHVSTLPATRSRRRLVRALMRRWPTERMYADLKQELGIDHYQGRTWPGWCHHVSVALAAYALLVSTRRETFPPSARTPSPAPPAVPTAPAADPQRRAA